MCEGTTISLILASGAIVGGGLRAAGTIVEGEERVRALEAQAALADMAAVDALGRGAQQERGLRLAAGRAFGQQRVAAAVSGVEGTAGTPADIMADTAMISAVDAETIRTNAARASWGYQIEAAQQRRAAAAARSSGIIGGVGGAISSGTTILGGLFG